MAEFWSALPSTWRRPSKSMREEPVTWVIPPFSGVMTVGASSVRVRVPITSFVQKLPGCTWQKSLSGICTGMPWANTDDESASKPQAALVAKSRDARNSVLINFIKCPLSQKMRPAVYITCGGGQ